MESTPKIIVPTPEKYLDVLNLGKFVDIVSELLQTGFGEATCRIQVQSGNITMISISKTETIKVETQEKKEYA